MGFRGFRLIVVLQISLILAIGALLAYLVLSTEYYSVALIVAVALALAIVALVRYVESVTRKLTRFLLAVRHSDYSQAFTADEKGRAFSDLAEAMDDVLERLRDTRSASEEQAIFLRTLVQHVPIAMIALSKSGEISLFNNAARRLLMVSDPYAIQVCDRLGDGFVEAVTSVEPGEHACSLSLAKADPIFRRLIQSLNGFAEDRAIWRELSLPRPAPVKPSNLRQ